MIIDEAQLVFEYFRSRADATGVMLDVGAHVGHSAVPFLEAGWKVFAFEPDPANRVKLESLAGRFPTLHIDPRAVSDRADKNVPFYTSKVSTGISGLSAFHESHSATARTETVTLADFCENHGVSEVSFLKTDAEGFDLFVLKGFPWERIEPAVVLCEFEDRKTLPQGYSFDDIADLLVDKGYRVLVSEWLPIVEYGREHKWNRMVSYPCELSQKGCWGNLIAFHREIDLDRWRTALLRAMGNQADALYKALADRRRIAWWLGLPIRKLLHRQGR